MEKEKKAAFLGAFFFIVLAACGYQGSGGHMVSPSFVVLPVVVDSSGSLPEEVRLQGPAGTSFSASPSAPWLQVTPTSGQIPPGGVAVLEVRAASCASPAQLPNLKTCTYSPQA
ncbi:hypothetical protein TthSNM76_23390 (plasmid) [Thermus thermophilus]|nr:hypothetical protein TthSNM76_23390 [Thermus thermophilus]